MRTLPGLGLRAYWAIGENGWGDIRSDDIRKVSVLTQLVAFSRVTELPDTPAPGDVHILLNEDSNSGAAGSIIVFEGDTGSEEWVYYTPEEGWIAWVIADGAEYRYIGGVWTLASAPALPTADQVAYNPQQDSNSGLGDSNVAAALDLLFLLINTGGNTPERPTFVNVDAGFTVAAASENVIYSVNESSNSPDSIFATIPHDSTENLPIGFSVSLIQNGTTQGYFRVEDDSNSSGETTLLYPSDMLPATRTRNSVITATKKAADVWMIFGDLEPA